MLRGAFNRRKWFVTDIRCKEIFKKPIFTKGGRRKLRKKLQMTIKVTNMWNAFYKATLRKKFSTYSWISKMDSKNER